MRLRRGRLLSQWKFYTHDQPDLVAYGLRTVGLGNTSVWLSAVTCGNYYSCSSEKYIAGDYSGLRGSGTVNLARSSGVTQITVNATLPDENTSVSQTMQFQNVIFTEACYY
jgi:hypothetical protein